MKKYAIIVAGGEGTRLGGGLPKQFRPLYGRPVLWWSLKAFHDEDPSVGICVVLHPDYFDVWRELIESLPEAERIRHEIVAGGKSRTESVKNGLAGIDVAYDNVMENAGDPKVSLVAVHDAARPMVTVDMIRRGWESAARFGGAVPAVPVTDSLRHLEGEGSVAVDRSEYVAVQTPQVFKTELLKAAYERNPDAIYSDDASAFEAAGWKPVLFQGSPLNMKITNPGDIEVATVLLNSQP